MAVNYYAPFGDGTYWRNITDLDDTTYGQIAIIDGKRKLVVGDKIGELCLVNGKRRYKVALDTYEYYVATAFGAITFNDAGVALCVDHNQFAEDSLLSVSYPHTYLDNQNRMWSDSVYHDSSSPFYPSYVNYVDGYLSGQVCRSTGRWSSEEQRYTSFDLCVLTFSELTLHHDAIRWINTLRCPGGPWPYSKTYEGVLSYKGYLIYELSGELTITLLGESSYSTTIHKQT